MNINFPGQGIPPHPRPREPETPKPAAIKQTRLGEKIMEKKPDAPTA